jgi:hypothetical protein
MKKVVFAFVVLLVIGAGMTRNNSVFAQTVGFPAITPLTNAFAPLTNQTGFTNTVVLTNNPTTVGLEEFSILLLTLQTNIELTLPVLALVTSNATPVNAQTNQQTGAFVPMTSIPGSLVPTGAASGTNPPLQASFALTFGTNVVVVDEQTLQALITLRDDLAGTLPVLQQLNGTTPPRTNAPVAVTPFVTPPFTPLTNPIPQLTNGFFFRPLTGMRFNP